MTFDKNARNRGLIPPEALNFKPTVTLVANVIYETEMSEDAYTFSFRGRNGWGWGTVNVMVF